MSDIEQLTCHQCGQLLPITNFGHLPLDKRCNRCIPVDMAMKLHDARVQEAGHVVAQLFDAHDAGKGLKPLERMVSQVYDAWGGSAAFCEDVVEWIKDLAEQGRGKGSAVNAAMKLLTLHAKVDRMRLDEDFKKMDDETLRASIKIRLAALLAETEEESAKEKAVKKILGDT
jgi:hypothetical protein